jgi:hypothetical protein
LVIEGAKYMRNMLGRLVLLLAFWFAFLDLFVGTPRGHRIWTIGVIGMFFFAEGAAKLALWGYSRYGNRESRKSDKPGGCDSGAPMGLF